MRPSHLADRAVERPLTAISLQGSFWPNAALYIRSRGNLGGHDPSDGV